MKKKYYEQSLSIKAKTLAKYESQFNKGASDECWLWTGPENDFGSGRFHGIVLNTTTFEKTLVQSSHRFAWILANSYVPCKNEVVVHNCGNKLCVNPAHLEMMTKAESLKCNWKNAPPRTIKVLSFGDAQAIRAEYADTGIGMIALAKKWGVTYLTINRVLNGTTHSITEAKLDKLNRGAE